VRRRKLPIIIDEYDLIEVASIDSFPASDPPGWIEAKANPCATGDAMVEAECLENADKKAKPPRAR
jgi:hypothetical protein